MAGKIENFNIEKKKLRKELNVGEKVLILAKRLKKKSASGKFYKQFVQIISYFNKKNIFIITSKRTIEGKIFCWLKNTKNNKYSNKRFQRQQLFAILNNFK